MSLSLDQMFAERVGARLDGFERKSSEKYVFRCPLCGDSKTDKKKKRGAFIRIDDSLGFKCKNCGAGMRFGTFLKQVDPGLHGDYQIELFQDRNDWTRAARGTSTTDEASKVEELVVPETLSLGDILGRTEVVQDKPKDALSDFDRISELRSEHPGRRYLSGRGIVKGIRGFEDLLWTDDFGTWAHEYTGKEKPKRLIDPRVVAPLITREGIVVGAQGRSISTDGRFKYITARIDNRFTAAYGAHILDWNDEIWVAEGVYDALALGNALAGLHSDLGGFARDYRLRKDRTVLLFDNEPGNWQVAKKLGEAVDAGWAVAFWKARQSEIGKDAADAIVKNGHKRSDLFTVAKGLDAKLQLSVWSGRMM